MYTEKDLLGSVIPLGTGVLGAEALTAAAVHGEYLFLKRAKVRRLMFYVTTAPDAAVTLEFNLRPTAGSATGEVALGTLVIPSGTAAGKIVYKDIDPEVLSAGHGLSFEVLAVNGATAGAGYYGFEIEPDYENALNESDMIASA